MRRRPPPAVTDAQWGRLVEEYGCCGHRPVVYWTRDPGLPPIYAGIEELGFNIAHGRGQTVDEAIDLAIRRQENWRRERRLDKSPGEWSI